MKLAKYLLAGAPALLAVTLAFTPLVRAESGRDSGGTTTTKTEDSPTSGTTTTSHTETNVGTTNETEVHSTESTSGRRTEEVARHRAELEEKVQEAKEENKTRLDDARKKVCENHQDKINNIIQKRSEQATKQLAVFNKISDRVQEFVKTKNLTVENYDTLVTAINDKEAAAQAAIEANSAVKFECATANGEKPTSVPRTTIEAVRTALHDYRTAIKNLIVNVKSAAEKKESTESSSSTESTSTSSSTTNGEVSR